MAAAFGIGTDAWFVSRWAAFALILALTASTRTMVALLGPAGSAITGTLYFLVGISISGASTAREFLAPFWHDLRSELTTGGGVTLLRNVFYFPRADNSDAIVVLATYAAAGLAILGTLNAIGHLRDRNSLSDLR